MFHCALSGCKSFIPGCWAGRVMALCCWSWLLAADVLEVIVGGYDWRRYLIVDICGGLGFLGLCWLFCLLAWSIVN